jgi:hypothetical protein
MKPAWMLFAAIFAGPIGWALSLQANFALAPLACSNAAKSSLYLVLVFAFLLASAGELVALSARQPTQPSPPNYQAMVWAGIGISAFSILLIVAQTIPTVFFAGCE